MQNLFASALQDAGIELDLTRAIVAPTPDVAEVGRLAERLKSCPASLDRAMFNAVHHAPRVPGGQGTAYLAVVELLLSLGVELPPMAAWVAYGDHLGRDNINPRAQAMTRLVVTRGGTGVEALRRVASRWPEYTRSHSEFLQSLG